MGSEVFLNNQFFRRYLPVIFIIITVFLVINAVMKISKHDVVETNILALLPQNTDNAILKHADEKLSKNIERRLDPFGWSYHGTKRREKCKKYFNSIIAKQVI